MALIALPTWWNVGRVVFLAKNSRILGDPPFTLSPGLWDRCERAYPGGSGWQQDLTSRQAGDQLAGPGQRTAPQAADRARSPSAWSPAWFSGRCCSSPSLPWFISPGRSSGQELRRHSSPVPKPQSAPRMTHRVRRVSVLPTVWGPSAPCPGFWQPRWPLEASQAPAL